MKRTAAKQKTKKTTSFKRARTGDYQRGRELNKAPKMELKAFDVPLTVTLNTGVAGPPAMNVLNAIVNGAELYQRVGRKTYMKSLHFRGWFHPNAAANDQMARLIIFYDSQPNAAAPTIQALLQDSNAAAATTSYSEINLTNRQRFKILRDKQYLFSFSSAATGQAELVPDPITNSWNVDEFIKLKGLETVYNGTNGGTVADITSGAIFMVLVGDAGADLAWQIDWHSRLRYYD